MSNEIFADPGKFFSEHFQDEGFRRELGEFQGELGKEVVAKSPRVKGFVDLRKRQLDLEAQLASVKAQIVPLQKEYDAALGSLMTAKGAGSPDEYVRKQFAARIAHAALSTLDYAAGVFRARSDFAFVDRNTMAMFEEQKSQLGNLRRTVREASLAAFASALKLSENGAAKSKAFEVFTSPDYTLDSENVWSFAGVANAQGPLSVFVFSPYAKDNVFAESLMEKLREFGDKGLPGIINLPGMSGKPGMVKFDYNSRQTPSGSIVSVFTPKYIAGLTSGDRPSLAEADKVPTAEAVLAKLIQVTSKEPGFERLSNARLQYGIVPIPNEFRHFAVARLLGARREEILAPEYVPKTTITKPEGAGHTFEPYSSIINAAQEARERIKALCNVGEGLTRAQLAGVLATPAHVVTKYGIPHSGNTSNVRYPVVGIEEFLDKSSYTEVKKSDPRGSKSFRWVPRDAPTKA
jgi:hypothetical protein